MDTEEDKRPNYHVCVKFLGEQSMRKEFRAHDLYEVSNDYRSYKPFRPTNEHNFSLKQKYGVVKNDTMQLMYILKMAANREDLEYGRVTMPPRKSIGDHSIPMKKLTLFQEDTGFNDVIKKKNIAEKEKKSKKHKNDSQVLKLLDNYEKSKKSKTSAKQSNDECRKSHKKKAEKSKEECSKKKPKITSESELEVIPHFSHKDADFEERELKHLENEKEQTSSAVSSAVENRDGSFGFISEQMVEDYTMTPQELTSVAQCIIAENEKKTESPEENRRKLPSYTELFNEVKSLKEKLSQKQEDISNKEMLAALGEQMRKVPELVRVYAPEKRFLEDVTFIVNPEKKYKDIQVPEGHVYCGNGIVVMKTDVYEATEATTLGRRVGKLCDAFYKGNVHQHFRSGKCQRAPADLKLYKITDSEVKAMKRLLKRMSWENVPGGNEITISKICVILKHYSSQAMTKFLGITRIRKKIVGKSSQKNQKQDQESSDSSSDSTDSSNSESAKRKPSKQKGSGKASSRNDQDSSSSNNSVEYKRFKPKGSDKASKNKQDSSSSNESVKYKRFKPKGSDKASKNKQDSSSSNESVKYKRFKPKGSDKASKNKQDSSSSNESKESAHFSAYELESDDSN